MLKRPFEGPYLEDDHADPDLDMVRRGDILMEPTAWAKDDAMNKVCPRRQALNVCYNGRLVGKIRQGGSVAVNCRDVKRDTGAVLAGYMRRGAVLDPHLLRPGVYQALSGLKSHIDAALDSFFASNDAYDFLHGDMSVRIIFAKARFQGIGLDGRYKDFPNLDELLAVLSAPETYNVSVQQYMDLPRLEWLMSLRARLEKYVSNYLAAHVKVGSCYSRESHSYVSFPDDYLPKMITGWEYDRDLDAPGKEDAGLKLKANFSRSDAENFVLREVKFRA